MHENVETWIDTCSCEAEPRWEALGEELEAQKNAANQFPIPPFLSGTDAPPKP